MSKTYEARLVPDARISLDGGLDAPAWQEADCETRFSFPWEDRQVPRTEFRAFFDEEAFYFAFHVEDDDIVLADDFRNKLDVMREDRVELFFALDDALAQYYCLEIDPLGRVLDYSASYYRRFDFSWSLAGLQAVGRPWPGGYCVKGLIPLRALAALGLPVADPERPIRFGIYRTAFRHADGPGHIEHWISWVDPGTPEPDFHVPASFGSLRWAR